MAAGRLRAALAGACVIACATGALAQQRRQPAPEMVAASGGYMLANADGSRRCLLLLRASGGDTGVGFIPHCRLTFPALAEVRRWTLETMDRPPHGHIRLLAGDGRIVFDFDASGDGASLSGRDPTGTRHSLTPQDGRDIASRFGAMPKPTPRPVVTTQPQTEDMPRMAALAGRYDLLRRQPDGTGCTLVLSLPTGGTPLARIGDGCTDRGVQTFSPRSWSLSGGTLWLMNERGQKLSFERTRAGAWEKGPGQGEPLTLRPRER